METAIIIVNYKVPWHLDQCLRSVFKHTQNFHIFLVHNPGDEKSIAVGDKFKKKYPSQITIKINQENLGYVGGVNSAYQEAIEFERVCFLNPDSIVTSGWLQELNKVLDEKDEVVQVSPDSNQYYDESLLWRLVRWQVKKRWPLTGDKIYKYMLYFNPPHTKEDLEFRDTGDAFYLFCGGFCNVIKSKYFKDLGYFLDPKIVHGYGDDFDLSYYLRQFGKLGTVNKSYVFHFVNASLKRLKTDGDYLKEHVKFLNRMYLIAKWEVRIKADMNIIGQERLIDLAQHHPEVKFMLEYYGLASVNPALKEYFKAAPANEYREQFLK